MDEVLNHKPHPEGLLRIIEAHAGRREVERGRRAETTGTQQQHFFLCRFDISVMQCL